MQFSPDMITAILEGRKTQTRRPVKSGETVNFDEFLFDEYAPADKILTVLKSGRVKWQVGRTYAVQPGRGKKAIGYIRLLGIRMEHVPSISREDALAEGFNSIDGFAEKWDELYPTGPYAWEHEPLCWVLEFELLFKLLKD